MPVQRFSGSTTTASRPSRSDSPGRWLCPLISRPVPASPYLISGSFHMFHPFPLLTIVPSYYSFPILYFCLVFFPSMYYQNPTWEFLPSCQSSLSPYVVSLFFLKPSFFGMNTHALNELFQEPASLKVKVSMSHKSAVTWRSLYSAVFTALVSTH